MIPNILLFARFENSGIVPSTRYYVTYEVTIIILLSVLSADKKKFSIDSEVLSAMREK